MTSLNCCTGTVHDHSTTQDIKPSGNIQTINNVKCYITSSNQSNTQSDILVILATDVFGYTLSNSRILADMFSNELNTTCIVPDLFKGSEPPVTVMDTLAPLQQKNASIWSKLYAICTLLYYFPGFVIRNPKSKSINIIKKVIKEYRSNNKHIRKVVLLGYCWG